jgi:hypothetical protein
MNTADLTRVADMNREHAKRRLAGTATDLRRLAERLDRLAQDFDRVGSTPGYVRHSNVAGDAVHEVMTFLANANFESMTQYAAEADVAMAEARSESEPAA